MSAGNESNTARLFFALWPDEVLRSRLSRISGMLRRTLSGKWVCPENLHVTLAFLGEVEMQRLPELRNIAAEIPGTAFSLILDRVEYWYRNGVICLGAGDTPPALAALAGSLSERLCEAGFALDKRPYKAHLTLARKGRAEHASTLLPDPLVWQVEGFSLVESRLRREGAGYIVLDSWPLLPSRLSPGASL